MRTDTRPDGPPGTVVSSKSTVSFLTGPDCTASTILRPWSGPSSNKNGGFALASTTALACGSRSTGVGMAASSSGPQLWCSASRPTAVVVPLPGQLPGHGKPGVGLGDLQLSAPQVLLDVDVGPALFSVDLVVECLAMGQRLVPSLHGVVPGQLPPLRHGSPPSSGPSGPSRLERPLPT